MHIFEEGPKNAVAERVGESAGKSDEDGGRAKISKI
jgi:hypothetical protein